MKFPCLTNKFSPQNKDSLGRWHFDEILELSYRRFRENPDKILMSFAFE